MKRVLFFSSLAAAAAFSAVVACGGASSDATATKPGAGPDDGQPLPSPGTPTSTPESDLPCDVQKVLGDHCQECHARPPRFGAPMSLVTRADLLATPKFGSGPRVIDEMIKRTASAESPMPPPPNALLSDAERAVLMAWSKDTPERAAGASCSGSTSTSDAGVGCTPDLPLGPASPYEMPAQAGDQYVCFGVDVTRPTPTHVVGFAPRIDNTTIVHHIVLFESTSSYPSTPTPCDSGTSLQWRMVMAWAPGGKGLTMPPEAGFPLQTSGATHYVVQMHYSNPQGLAGQKDTSGFDLCTSAPRANEADVLAFGTEKIDIPPATATYSRTCSVKVPSQLAGLHFIAAMPHMHKLGTGMTTTLKPAAGGAAVDLGSQPSFSFATQAWLPVAATSATNDVITTTCTWSNPTGPEVKYGEKTSDEMCYSFTAYYPKVQSPIWSWATPAYTSTCQ